MSLLSRILAILMIGIIAGCSKPVADTSTEATTTSSLKKVRESLPESEQAKFDEALKEIIGSHISLAGFMSGQSPDSIRQQALGDVNGKNGEQIIAEGEHIKADRAAKEKEQALKEIADLEAKAKAANEARKKLAEFQVIKSRYFVRHTDFMDQPIIQLTVKNGTDKAISRAYFHGVVASKGRAVPWISEDFNYQIAGGLQPGEKATWRLAPNPFSSWGSTKVPSDAIMTVTVVMLDGADGKTLYDGQGLSDSEQSRLKELKQQYAK